ncbi:MAG: carboxymuconolactone decarboxylase family protein [Burkholderiaceae bacterium]|nr:carboxymuconolactone decarboxylase family protein [Burkholderiaceae bacterium]
MCAQTLMNYPPMEPIDAARTSADRCWRALANDPKQLKLTWEQVKTVMSQGALDPLTKGLIYIAVSAANGCGYCLHTHAASARAKGMTPEMFAELMQVVVLASQTNRIAIGLQVEVDERYKESPR